ncbi:DNA-3-methyladenine glycosylase I [Psychroflexus aestuariivivens]|uniref:DNA-3-methyladenine glycosylase I n=1 Tax=Psychroflexus aestuariivivens TaxID=1795040 RepID=UPI000FDA8FA2|nr:DNA-3-methyladenine glycosylase I [Psychroflexus aestuariivivens]
MTKIRCDWCVGDELYENYHDSEWGEPVRNDRKLFEFLVLESFQAGLSWITILKKRDNFKQAFEDFDYTKIANYNSGKVEELLTDSGIIRHRAKIEATIQNAKAFIEIQNEFGSFSDYIWNFLNHRSKLNQFEFLDEVPAQTELSQRISKDLKKRGFKFLGPTTVYAFMQAVGLVNDHLTKCFKHKKAPENKF